MTAEELAIAKASLALLKQRIAAVRASAPHNLPSEKQLFIMAFPQLTGAGDGEPVRETSRIGSDAAFIVQKVLLLAPGGGNRGMQGFFSILDKASGGRVLLESQRSSRDFNSRFPVNHFANTLPDSDQAACYSFFPLHSEYLLPKGSAVEVIYEGAGVNNQLLVALAGYKVYA